MHGKRQNRSIFLPLVPRTATVISCAAALLIGFINPILCLIHCAFSHQHATLTSEQQIFLCDLGPRITSSISAPFSAVWSNPRAVYPALQVAPPMLVVIFIVVLRLDFLIAAVRIYLPPPSFPPPKVRPHLTVR
ncbi:hypothetical protein EYB53_024485 [Candidatus Chloroploca sp. M-50]|uniref:Uncharacterized protein n=1 Tax=Candidatus Chloroploca mongolica TaxID=2528176 RepID=A0ABS4DHH5_9CHLR|nr:hypothetical protein [Candidatus Chloroploca mongolica]MBP1468889.1 hypothetical protein [Candidatus Chloroploca mongolica]